MNLITNERTKLTANWMNALGSGVIITGVVAPSVALLFQIGNPFHVPAWVIVAASMVWLFVGIALHYLARRMLGRLI